MNYEQQELSQFDKDCIKNINNSILSGERLNTSSVKSGTRQGCLLPTSLLNIILEVLADAIRQENKVKGIQIGNEEIHTFLFTNDMVLL